MPLHLCRRLQPILYRRFMYEHRRVLAQSSKFITGLCIARVDQPPAGSMVEDERSSVASMGHLDAVDGRQVERGQEGAGVGALTVITDDQDVFRRHTPGKQKGVIQSNHSHLARPA